MSRLAISALETFTPFSKLKAHLRKIGVRTFTDLFTALGDVCQMFTPDECWNYFQDAGLVVPEN